MEVAFSRGSVWRRWDLHVHTPASVFENKFPDWDSYVDEFEARGKEVSVVGVTDYVSIEGYKRLLEYRAQGRLKSFELLIPNIEFRAQPQTATGQAVNLHLLVSPHQPDHVQRIESAFQKLMFTFDGTDYPCTREGLVALGKAHDPKQTDEGGAFKQGALQFKPTYETIEKWIRKDAWLNANSIFVISTKNDGTGGLKEAGFAAVRQELFRLSHALFSSDPNDRKYFLGRGVDVAEEVVRKHGSLKPCIHGCDAHEIDRLFEPNLKRYCWIKADPTFEGLRQICHEPDDRVHIGESPPAAFDNSKIIDSVHLDFPAVFASPLIKLNPGLVAIIGEKGSGKTALAEVIAYACGAHPVPPGSTSFIRRAANQLYGAKATVEWADKKTSPATIPTVPKLAAPLVRYLSQDFVERLCSDDLSGSELVKEIEGVVFSHLGEADTLGASSFEDLRRLKTQTIVTRRNAVGAQINELNAQLDQLQKVIDDLPKKEASLTSVTADIAAIDAQLPALEAGVNQEIAQKLSAENASLAELNSQLTGVNRKRSNVQTARGEVEDYEENVSDEFEKVAKTLLEIGISSDVVNTLKPAFPTTVRDLLHSMDSELASQAASLSGSDDSPKEGGGSIADVRHRISSLQQQLASDAQVRERLIALQTQRGRLVAEQARIQREIEDINGKHAGTFSSKANERWTAYGSYFDLLKLEAAALEELYKPLSKILKKDVAADTSEFELSIRLSVDAEAWIDTGRGLVDNRKVHPLSDREGAKDLAEELTAAWRGGDKAAIRERIEQFRAGMGGAGGRIEDMLLSHATRKQFFDWLFSADHLSIMYSLKYGDTDLQALSPGTRGIVLLMLYLRMDTQDRKPLIIDQPEGNLDSASIYRLLVPFLREAKRTRQIILVSHNPNLVVATDADQVIIAEMERKASGQIPELSYRGGALEDASGPESTRLTVCRILEGGTEAFKTRETRYAIPGRIPAGMT